MTTDSTDDTEEPKKGRSNAIMTYEKIESIFVGLATLNTKLDRVSRDIADIGNQHDDHDVRIRALELALAASTSSRATVGSLWAGAIAIVAVGISLLQYLNNLAN